MMQTPDVPSGLTLDGRSVSRTVGMEQEEALVAALSVWCWHR